MSLGTSQGRQFKTTRKASIFRNLFSAERYYFLKFKLNISKFTVESSFQIFVAKNRSKAMFCLNMDIGHPPTAHTTLHEWLGHRTFYDKQIKILAYRIKKFKFKNQWRSLQVVVVIFNKVEIFKEVLCSKFLNKPLF